MLGIEKDDREDVFLPEAEDPEGVRGPVLADTLAAVLRHAARKGIVQLLIHARRDDPRPEPPVMEYLFPEEL